MSSGGSLVWERWTSDKAEARADLVGLVEAFDAGDREAALAASRWLRERSLSMAGVAVTWLAIDEAGLAGFFALSSASATLRQSQRRGLAPPEAPGTLPAALVAWIAADASRRGEGIGEALLRHAHATAQEAASWQGSVLLVVDPFDEASDEMWRKRFGFRASRTPAGTPGLKRLWTPLLHAR